MTETQKLIQARTCILNAMRELQNNYDRDMEGYKQNLQSINNELYDLERDSLKCCGNCGFNKLYSNGQYEIEQMCGYDHECKTSPDISMSLINHWQPLPEPPKETK